MPASVAESCLADDILFAFATGSLAPNLRGQAEAHLRKCEDCRAILAELARSLESPEEAVDAVGPNQIGRYTLGALIGAGASAVVYRAFDESLRRTVALKVLRPSPQPPTASARARTLREAQAMARLSHPNVVTVYDAGTHQGRVYIVMEHVDGLTLAAWLAAQQRSAHEVLRVFLEAGRGLQAAHRKGLVHRDFKPENVLVAEGAHAKVTDFGLARLGQLPVDTSALRTASVDSTTLTRGLVGTPAYMAPELFEGTPASSKSDQFAFCVALYVGLFGRHPYRAGEGIELGELITRARSEVREEPPAMTPVHQRLLGILRRGLSADPDARFSDMDQLLGALGKAARPSVTRAAAWLLPLALLGAGAWLWAPATAEPPRQAPAAPAGRTADYPPVVPATPSPTARPAPDVIGNQSPALAPMVPSGAPSSSATTTPRARPLSPREVRYRDGLKEPF